MPEVLLDTGVWFGYFDENDLFHHDANALVTDLLADGKKILLWILLSRPAHSTGKLMSFIPLMKS